MVRQSHGQSKGLGEPVVAWGSMNEENKEMVKKEEGDGKFAWRPSTLGEIWGHARNLFKGKMKCLIPKAPIQ